MYYQEREEKTKREQPFPGSCLQALFLSLIHPQFPQLQSVHSVPEVAVIWIHLKKLCGILQLQQMKLPWFDKITKKCKELANIHMFKKGAKQPWCGGCSDIQLVLELPDNINTDKEQKPDKCNPDTSLCVIPLRITQQLKISNSVTFPKDNASIPWGNHKPFTDSSWISTF